MNTLLQDLRYAARMLIKQRGFTLVAVLTLGLGIGANSAIFSLVNAVLLRSLPYPEAERLFTLWEKHASSERTVVALANFRDWEAQNRVFERMAAVMNVRMVLTGAGEAEELLGQVVTAGFFPALGVQPFLGRGFLPEEEREGGKFAVILSHRLWATHFNSDPEVVGRAAILNGQSFIVVGVMPRDFNFLEMRADFWRPLPFTPAPQARAQLNRGLRCVARLKPGIAVQQAQAEMDTIARRLEASYPGTNRGWGVVLVSSHDQVVGDVRAALLALTGAVAFVLLIVCANLANLSLARNLTKRKELAIRAALGASRFQLARQLLIESLLLALFGGAGGVLLAFVGIKVLVALGPPTLPRLSEVGVDGATLSFTLAVSLLTGIGFGLAPALQASKFSFGLELNEALKEGSLSATGSLRGHRFRSFLVIAEAAVALNLLVGAGLMIRSFLQLQQVDPGFNPEAVLMIRVALPTTKYRGQQRASFFRHTLERVRTLPGVEAASAINYVSLTGLSPTTTFTIEGRSAAAPNEKPVAGVRLIEETYFRTLKIPLRRGREFTELDAREDGRAVIINETLARHYWPNEDPVGRRIVVDWERQVADEIVGVVGDVRERGLTAPVEPLLYWPHGREPYPTMALLARTTVDPMNIAAAVAREIRAVDQGVPVAEVRPLTEALSDSTSRARFNMLLLSLFAVLGLALAAVGIYAVMACLVSQRTREIGIRIALGAQQQDVLKLVVGQGMKWALTGVSLGLATSLALTRLLSGLLYGVTATDPLTFIGVAVMLLGVTLLACYLPARRATKVDPLVALRCE